MKYPFHPRYLQSLLLARYLQAVKVLTDNSFVPPHCQREIIRSAEATMQNHSTLT